MIFKDYYDSYNQFSPSNYFLDFKIDYLNFWVIFKPNFSYFLYLIIFINFL
jgi:hypothetical protein